MDQVTNNPQDNVTLPQAVRQTIEALERYQVKRQDFDTFADVINVPRAALEQPAVEPYGWHVTGSNELLRGEYAQSDAESDAKRCGGTARAVALYTVPQPQQPAPVQEQQPVARFNWNKGGFEWLTKYDFDKHNLQPLYLAAQPRKAEPAPLVKGLKP